MSGNPGWSIRIGEWMGSLAVAFGIFGHYWGMDVPNRTYSVACGCAFYLQTLVGRKRAGDTGDKT